MSADCLPHIHVAAVHAERGYHSGIPGIGVLCRKNELLVGAGVYQNSVKGDGPRKTTAYVAGGWQPLQLRGVRAGLIVGLATGYRPGPVPLAAGFVSWRHVHFILIPPVKDVTPATAAVSFTWGWK